MAKRRTTAKPQAEKPVVKAQVKKVAIPEGLATTFEARPDIKEAYVSGDDWKFNKLWAKRDWKEFDVVSNPHFK